MVYLMFLLKELSESGLNAKSCFLFNVYYKIWGKNINQTNKCKIRVLCQKKRSQFVHLLDSERKENYRAFNKHLMSVNYAPSSCLS